MSASRLTDNRNHYSLHAPTIALHSSIKVQSVLGLGLKNIKSTSSRHNFSVPIHRYASLPHDRRSNDVDGDMLVLRDFSFAHLK